MNSVLSPGGGVFSDMSAPCRAVLWTPRTGAPRPRSRPGGGSTGDSPSIQCDLASRAASPLTGDDSPEHRRTAWAVGGLDEQPASNPSGRGDARRRPAPRVVRRRRRGRAVRGSHPVAQQACRARTASLPSPTGLPTRSDSSAEPEPEPEPDSADALGDPSETCRTDSRRRPLRTRRHPARQPRRLPRRPPRTPTTRRPRTRTACPPASGGSWRRSWPGSRSASRWSCGRVGGGRGSPTSRPARPRRPG